MSKELSNIAFLVWSRIILFEYDSWKVLNSRVNEATDVLRTFQSDANGIEWYEWTLNDALPNESVVLCFVVWLRYPSLPCAQSNCHHGQWCKEVNAISPVGHSFLPTSSDDTIASQLIGFVQHIDRSL
ncbi:hypothetical protein TNCV_4216151 [Trichonephila clavipes]|nr:hypothetical protein TNCV_4216151 [Trichonephila clavipes]